MLKKIINSTNIIIIYPVTLHYLKINCYSPLAQGYPAF